MAIHMLSDADVSSRFTTASAWTDWDTTLDGVPAGATGIILLLAPTTSRTIGFRKNGSTTDNPKGAITQNYQATVFCGVDGSGIAEYWVSATTSLTIYLIGYFDSDETFITDPADKSSGITLSSWSNTVTLSEVAAGSKGALWGILHSGGNAWAREKGSTDATTSLFLSGQGAFPGAVCGIDANKDVELYKSVAATKIFFLGYSSTIDPVINPLAGTNLKGTVSTWTEKDPSVSADAGVGIFLCQPHVGASDTVGIRDSSSAVDAKPRKFVTAQGQFALVVSQIGSDGLIDTYFGNSATIGIFKLAESIAIPDAPSLAVAVIAGAEDTQIRSTLTHAAFTLGTQVQQKLASDPDGNYADIYNNAAAKPATVDDTGLTGNTQYTYRFRNSNSVGSGAWSTAMSEYTYRLFEYETQDQNSAAAQRWVALLDEAAGNELVVLSKGQSVFETPKYIYRVRLDRSGTTGDVTVVMLSDAPTETGDMKQHQ